METTTASLVRTHQAKPYWRNCAALMALLALTWSIGYIDLGMFNVIVALAIAIIKALLVVLFFMHIKGASRVLHLAASIGVIWLLIMLALTLSDYFTRLGTDKSLRCDSVFAAGSAFGRTISSSAAINK
jgi:cytochrome c oxidase subunit 4